MTEREPSTDESLDPGAYIGREPELDAETIPGGVGPEDERVSAYDSRPGVVNEPKGSPEPTAPCDDQAEGR